MKIGIYTLTSLFFEEGVLAWDDPSLRGLEGPSFFLSGPFSCGERSPFKGLLGWK